MTTRSGPVGRVSRRSGRVPAVAAAGDSGAPGGPPLSNGPLVGFRILDMGTFVAGPYAGSLLSELGADVIKVEPLGGDPFRVSGFVFNRACAAWPSTWPCPTGRTPSGAWPRPATSSSSPCGLASRPSWASTTTRSRSAPGRHHRLAVGLRRGRPAVGPPRRRHGPAGHERHDERAGRRLRAGREHHRHHRRHDRRDAGPQHVPGPAPPPGAPRLQGLHSAPGASLAGTATYLQSGEIVRFAGGPPSPTGGRDYLGADPFDRYYPTTDGWIRHRRRRVRPR